MTQKPIKTQIPPEAIKGPAGIDADFTIVSLTAQQIRKLEEAKKEWKTLVTNTNVREMVKSTDLIAGKVSSIKVYDNKEKPKEDKKGMGRED